MNESVEKTIVIVQGPESAAYLIEQYGKSQQNGSMRWVCYDVRAGELLRAGGISFQWMKDLVPRETLEEVDEHARNLSTRWYRDAEPQSVVANQHLYLESVFHREFNYFFLGVFKAYHLLKGIAVREDGPMRILTTEWDSPPDFSLRYARDEGSAIASILSVEVLPWKMKVKIENLPCPTGKRSGLRSSLIEKWAQVFFDAISGIKRAETLFAGSPSLLSPLVEEYQKKGRRQCLTIRWVDSKKQWVALLQRSRFAFFVQNARLNGSCGFDEERARSLFLERKTFLYDGVDLLPVIWKRLKAFYTIRLPRAHCHFSRLSELLVKMGVQQVVVDEDGTELNGTLVLAAKGLDIPSAVVLHGPPIKPPGFVPLKADRIAVWGERDAEFLRGWGLENHQIQVTGCPRYDALTRLRHQPFNDKQKMLILIAPANLPSNCLEVFESLGSNPFEHVRYIEYFLRVAHQVRNAQFLFKYHTDSWDGTLFKQVAFRVGGIPRNVRVVPQGNAIPYMQSCNLIFCGYSSLVFEAMHLSKPVAVVNFSEFAHPFGLDEKTYPFYVSTCERALEICQSLTQGTLATERMIEILDRYTDRFFYAKDGLSAMRTAEWLLSSRETKNRDADFSMAGLMTGAGRRL